jgi:hypothetical protein
MRKLKLDIDRLTVESFAPAAGQAEGGTVRGYLSAYYELCNVGDTWQQSCTCEPTCNAATCYNCGSAQCASAGCPPSGRPYCELQSIPLTNCSLC